jgi:hypothetical protein
MASQHSEGRELSEMCEKRQKVEKMETKCQGPVTLLTREIKLSLSVNSAAFKIMAEGERLPSTTLPQLRLTAYIIIMQYRQMLIKRNRYIVDKKDFVS